MAAKRKVVKKDPTQPIIPKLNEVQKLGLICEAMNALASAGMVHDSDLVYEEIEAWVYALGHVRRNIFPKTAKSKKEQEKDKKAHLTSVPLADVIAFSKNSPTEIS